MHLDKRLLRLARAGRGALILTIAFGFAAGIAVVLQAALFSRVVDRVFLQGYDRAQVSHWIGGLLLAMIGRAVLSWASEVSAAVAARRIKLILRRSLYQRIIDRGPAFLSDAHTGELTHTLLDGVEALDAYFSQYLPGLALAAIVPLTLIIAVFPVDQLSAVLLLLTAPLIPLFMMLIGSAARSLTQRQYLLLSRMSAYFLDVLQGLTTLKHLNRSRAQAKVITEVGERYRLATMSVLRVTFLSSLVLELVATLSTAVVAVQIGLRLLYGQLEFEQAFLVLLLAPEFYLPLRLLGMHFHAGMSGVTAAARIFEVLDGDDPGPSVMAQAKVPDSITPRPTTIRLENIQVAYRTGRPALQNVNLTIGPGESVALVGPSGSGKSTLAAIIMGFVAPDSGQVWVDDHRLGEIALEEWRAQVAWVPQSPTLFDDSILENIRMARPDATQEEVVSAARQAEAHEFISLLPDGYHTRIGEAGARISGGEAQRLALARAFLRDAPFVILDEPTAHLDPEAEARILISLERLLEGRSALIIAHRLNTARRSDRIYLLSGGQVQAAGSHEEMLENSLDYRRLVRAYTGDTMLADIHPEMPEMDEALKDTNSGGLGFNAILPTAAPVLAGQTNDPITGTPQSRLRVLGRLLAFLRPFAGKVVLSALCGAVTTLAGVGLMATSAFIISAAALHPSIAVLQVSIVGVRFFGLARGVFRYLERLLSHDLTFRLLARLRVWFYTALEPLAPAHLVGSHSGDLLARIIGDIASLENFYVRVAAPPLSALIVGLTVGMLLARFDTGIALLWTAAWAAAGVGIPMLGALLGRGPGQRSVEARANLSRALVSGIQGLPDLLAYGRTQTWQRYIEAHSSALATANESASAVSSLQNALNNLTANLTLLGVVVLGIPLVRSGALDGIYLASLALIAQTGFEAIAPLPAAARYLESSLQAARRLFAVVDNSPAVPEPPVGAAPLPPIPLTTGVHLSVRSLSFRYPGENIPLTPPESPALQDISYDLAPGRWMALVGPSGAGKTTLAGLLLRFWNAQAGEILLDGRDIHSMASEDVRQYFAVVDQRAYLFNATVHDNLRLARPHATPGEIVKAAQAAKIHDFIETLPQGYDTWIGERGQRLSGGERQRLAIARALLKDAPILLLDEATSGLDSLTENQVLDAAFHAARGRSLLWITHRMVHMERMDEILVLDGGRVVERGNHTALLQSAGLYRRLWELQNQILRET